MNEKICPTCGTEYPANERFCPRDGSALKAQGSENDLVGSVIAERYHVMKKLGEGGMGQVYLAEHVKMGRKSAVKVMNPGMVENADAISRFNREAANASRINHPNVAGIYDFGETNDGLIYLAMEFIEGQSLTSLLETEGALTPARAAEIIRQTGEGLAVAHDMGIVHRDLKPDNIMIAKGREGTDLVKVVDFGIAKAAGAENQKVTKTGLIVGTPEYMSPEQLAGDKLDKRSDIYSLGLVAFNVLTGKLPFQAESAQESMIQRLTEEAATLQSVKPDTNWTPEVQRVMKKALEMRRENRYEFANTFGAELSEAVALMPKGTPGATMVIPAANGAGAASSAAPATRVDARASNPTPNGTPATVAAKSRTPLYAGGGIAALAIAAAAIFMLKDKGGATPAGTAPVPAVTANQQGGTQNTGAQPPVNTPAANSSPTSRTPDRQKPVTSAPSGVQVSYGAELEQLANSINDVTGANAALQKVSEYEGKVTLPTDKVTLRFVEAKATLLTNSGDKGCRIFGTINRDLLANGLRSDLDEAVKTCKQ